MSEGTGTAAFVHPPEDAVFAQLYRRYHRPVRDSEIVDNRFTSEGVDDVHLATAEYERITGWCHQDPQCTATTVRPPQVDVTCRYAMANALSEALDTGPFGGSWFEFVVADGRIQEIAHHFDYG